LSLHDALPISGISSNPCRRAARTRSAAVRSLTTRSELPAAHGRTPNRKTVVEVKVSPGRRTVDGNDGWFGESGKCCVSRQKPACRGYVRPPRPSIGLPKLPL